MRRTALLAIFGICSASPVLAVTSPHSVDRVSETDVEGRMGDCGEYLSRHPGDLIFVDTWDDYAYMKIDGNVVHLAPIFSRTAPPPSGLDIYFADQGRIQVAVDTHTTTTINYENLAVAGTLTLIVDGDAQVIPVIGTDGC